MARSNAPAISRRTRNLIIAAAVIAAAAAVILLFPARTADSGTGTAREVQPMFTKHGEVTFISPRNEFQAKFDVEIAADEVRRELGLMGRPTMEERQGMLFIFDEAHPVSFWMKNTILPLDIIMIDANRTVITIHRNTTPFSEQTYPSTGPVKYVVEVNAGIADKYGIAVGSSILWQRQN